MKKNFIVTTGLIDTWEFHENNFLLGNWCELYETNNEDERKYNNKIPNATTIIKNEHHWNDNEKRNEDYKYLQEQLEYLLEVISEKLSIIHDVKESKEYWRVIIYSWLIEYFVIIFDRWESIRTFFEKNKNKKFYTNFINLEDSAYLPKNHINFCEIAQNHEWNHSVFLRIFNFLNIKNVSLIEKKNIGNNLKNVPFFKKQNFSLRTYFLKSIDKVISKFAFKFNKVIFESFYFPKKEYLKICLRCKLIPSKYSNFFNFDIKEKKVLKNDKRIQFKNLLLKIENKDKFIEFLLSNIHKDMPVSYIENFDAINKKLLPYAKKKKIIFSMTSLYRNDNFKLYLAETKKVGSKYIHSIHGGGLTFQKNNDYFDLFEKVSDKIIKWGGDVTNDLFVNLSPTLPIIKLKNSKIGSDCSIIFVEQSKYLNKFPESLILDQSIHFFNELTNFVDKLNPEIKSKVKFRAKRNKGYNCEKKFSEIFGSKHIDKISVKNPFEKTIANSKLIIVTYPQTTFSEAMYSNVPTILIIKRNYYQFTGESSHIFNVLKKNKIAFDDFEEAKIHINENWKTINSWWNSPSVQSARKYFLTNFFNVKSEWVKEWSDYIYLAKGL